MEAGAKKFDWIKALKRKDKNRYKRICHTIREDGAYIEVGETKQISTSPRHQLTEDYITGRFG